MNLPNGVTEDDLVVAVGLCMDRLAKKFSFGVYGPDDLRQMGFVWAAEALSKNKYDASRPLAPYLYRHIFRRCLNLRRNLLTRRDAPCRDCHEGRPCQQDGSECKVYSNWKLRNRTKAAIQQAISTDNVSEAEPGLAARSCPVKTAETNDLRRLIDERLPLELRASYLQMLHGVTVPKGKRRLVRQSVLAILDEADVALEDLGLSADALEDYRQEKMTGDKAVSKPTSTVGGEVPGATSRAA